MRVYRIEREKHLKQTLHGIGASLSNGFRWNSIQTCMVYTAENRALAMLEIAVHLDLSEDLPQDRYLVVIDIPDNLSIMHINENQMPKGWDSKPPMRFTQRLGDQFISEKHSAVLKVPSSIVPEEYNYLLNPHHPDMKKIKIVSKQKIIIDSRLKY